MTTDTEPAGSAQALERLRVEMADMRLHLLEVDKELVDIARRQRAQGKELQRVLNALGNVVAGTPSGFMGFTADWRGSVNMTKRILKVVLSAATGLITLYGVYRLGTEHGSEREAVPPAAPAASQPQAAK